MIRFLKKKTILLLFILYGLCKSDSYSQIDCTADNLDFETELD